MVPRKPAGRSWMRVALGISVDGSGIGGSGGGVGGVGGMGVLVLVGTGRRRRAEGEAMVACRSAVLNDVGYWTTALRLLLLLLLLPLGNGQYHLESGLK